MADDNDCVVSSELDLQKMKVADLKKELKEHGLPIGGTKAELITRLQKFIEESEADSAKAPNEVVTPEATEEVVQNEEQPEETEETKVVEEPPEKPPVVLKEPIKPPDSSTSAGKISSSQLSEAERLKKRAERFGLMSDDDKKEARAAKFGIQSQNKTLTTSRSFAATPVTPDDMDRLKKRAERFGTVVSTALTKLEGEARLRKRKERFGTAVRTTTTTTTTTTAGGNSSPSVAEIEEKKRKRVERFGLT